MEQIVTVDVRKDSRDRPKAFNMSPRQQQELRKYFDALPIESRVREAAGMIVALLDKKYDAITSQDLKGYVVRVLENLDGAQLKDVETSPHAVARRIIDKIDGLLDEYRAEQFYDRLDDESVVVRPDYQFPQRITLSDPNTSVGGGLYEAEGQMNQDERDLIMSVAALENIAWWHRVIDRAQDAFFINGPLNHYPDFIACTNSGKIIVIEPKGEHLKNDDSRRKIRLGKAWADAAGPKYRYYMVFKDGVEPLDGALTTSKFLSQIEKL